MKKSIQIPKEIISNAWTWEKEAEFFASIINTTRKDESYTQKMARANNPKYNRFITKKLVVGK